MNNGFSNWDWSLGGESLIVGLGLFLIGFVLTVPLIIKRSELKFFKKFREVNGKGTGNDRR